MLRTVPFLVAVLVFGSIPGRRDALAQHVEPAYAAILAAVNDYRDLTIFDEVTVSVRDGVATLDGKVTRSFKRDELGARVAHLVKTYGLRDLRNRIDVLVESPADDELRKQTARAIYGNAAFWSAAVMPSPPIRIIVEDGHVTLTGTVNSEVDRALARTLALQAGARSVTNLLKTTVHVQVSREGSR
jgi:osmotically-inducible protein OsmY